MILMVYNTQICKEFLLPNLHDEDYTIYLRRDIYRLRRDVELKLENSAKGWELLSGESYQIKAHGEYRERFLLENQEIADVRTREGDRFQIIVADCTPDFMVMEKYDISAMKEVSVGKSPGNLIQYQFMELVSASHATLRKEQDGWYLTDTSSNGVFCGNLRMQGRRKLLFGDHIDIFGLHLLFLGNILAAGAYYGEFKVKEDILRPVFIKEIKKEDLNAREKKEQQWFHRSPRNLPTIYREETEIEAPPSPKAVKEKPLYMTIGPAFTMAIPMMLGCAFAIFGSRLSGYTSSAFMYTGLITALSSALIGVVWAILNLNYSKKENEREEAVRFNAYSNYLIQIADSLRGKYQHNTAAMLQMYPSAAQCISYNENSSELWNRNYSHEDFLYQRIGLGDHPFQVDIQIPKEKFTLINDSLLDKPKMIQEEFKTLHGVPVGVSLMDKRLIGLVGGNGKKGAVSLMHSLVAGIAAGHCYTDVKLVFIYREEDPERREDWECMRWFPHVWSEDKSTRYMASNELETGDIFFELSNVIRARSQEKKNFVKPHYVLFISDPSILEGEIMAKYIYEAKPDYGITTFLMAEALEQLPNECEEIIENDSHFQGFYSLMDTGDKKQAFVPDQVTAAQLSVFGKTLANIRVNEIESTSEIPSSLDFFSMYGVHTLEELDVLGRWRKNRNYNSMKALIGRKAGNADCYLDIHEKFHGPHGLVAGTTGSGKSETLQTYILSLAVNFSPEDVSFFIIDFKGGGMANLFSGLPHLSGQISNLSGNQVRRAMISIKSENMRRQRLFSEYGVNNINLYTRLYKNQEAKIPIPHLFIIIDEFAELKREEPDFMKELISVAQVGRSLGVHLILATQKPSGTVDDNIWSNSKFRLCLRVQDRQDSNDMLHKPDAAFITQAGRCYLQVGNDEIYELFQSGYSGAAYEEYTGKSTQAALLTRTGKAELIGGTHRRKEELRAAGKNSKEKTQLDAVIEYLDALVKDGGYRETMKLWLPVLKTQIYLEELGDCAECGYRDGRWKKRDGKWSLRTAIGMYDDPEQQAQRPLFIDLSADGHHAVCGSVVSGKSTFLQSLVYGFLMKYSPDMLQMYLIDFSSNMLAAFEEAPHVGGVISDNQEERLAKFMHMLTLMMDERRRIFKGGNYSQYVQAHGVTVPAVMVVIDNMASFREKTKFLYDEVLLRLAREGVGYGIFLVASAAGFGMAEIPSRIGDNIRTVLSLEQADKFKYMEILRTTRLGILPETDVRGRGLANVDGRILEFQTALALPAADDFERGQKIEKICRDMRENWDGAVAPPIPEIPEKPTLQILCGDERYRKAVSDPRLLPAGYYRKDAEIYSLDLMHTYCYFISGRGRTGKTNLLKMLMHAAWLKQGKLCVIEQEGGELSGLAEEYGAEYVTDGAQLFRYLSELLPVFAGRNKKKQALLAKGAEEAEVFRQMSEEQPLFIFLADVKEFVQMVYKPGEGVGNMSGFVENILEKGSLHNIYFIGCLKAEEQSLLAAYKAYQLFTGYKKGIHLGGNLTAQKLFHFQNIAYAQQSKVMKKGLGYVPDEEEESNGIEVVIPLAKK
ncbi:type VII secretion protein EssC [Faecalimonas umbilicata]|nr:type VII secretion protein EssC [Faecalimonas umbilicata]